MLLGKQRFDRTSAPAAGAGFRRTSWAAGPLGLFLEATIGRRRREEDGEATLDVINIRDWHINDDIYDGERKSYGSHCERGTWGAAYIEGLERYPRSARDSRDGGSALLRGGQRPHPPRPRRLALRLPAAVGVHRRPPAGSSRSRRSRSSSTLLQGSTEDLGDDARDAARRGRPRALFELASEIDADEEMRATTASTSR